MFKKIITFLLFVFFTQTVLAGFDLHYGSENNASSDIVEHYIDAHSAIELCDYNSENNSNNMTVHSGIDDAHHNDSDKHQHSCHGHTISFTYTNFSILNFDFTHFPSTFFYVFIKPSIIVSPAYRPPIAA